MDRTERINEFREVFKGIDEGKRVIVDRLIQEAVFIEEQLDALREYPLIKFHPSNPKLQKITAAGKQYREYLQTYTNIIRALERTYANEETESTSPLREYLNRLNVR